MLREDSLKIEHELFIRSFFGVQPPARVAKQLAASMQERPARAGEVLFEIGAPSDQIYFVVSGQVALEVEGKDPWTFNDRSMVGIVDCMMERPRTRRARAMTNSALLRIHLQDYFEILEDNFEYAKTGIRMANQLIHRLSQQLAPDRVFANEDAQRAYRVTTLEKPLPLIERVQVLYHSAFLRGGPVQPIVRLAALAEESEHPPGEVIFRPTENNSALDFVVSGTVRLDRAEPEIRALMGPGTLLEAHAAIGFDEHQYQAVAETDVRLLRIHHEDLFDVMEDHFALAKLGFAYGSRENERAREELGQRARPTGLAVNLNRV